MSKTFTRLVVIALLVMLALPVIIAGAQEDVESDVPENIAGFYLMDVSAGSLAENEDGSYLLTLEGVAEETRWAFNAPVLDAGRYSTLNLATAWAAAPEGLEASALLELEGMTLVLSLSDPVYDLETETQSFTVLIDDIYSVEDVKGGPEAPEAFDQATLFINIDHAFTTGLLAGYDVRMAEVRLGTPIDKPPAGGGK